MAKLSKLGQAPMQLAVINHNAAAIDVGSMLMMVSYSDAEGNLHLLETDGYTHSLTALANTLKQAGVKGVAMEATGVYWMSLYEVLEEHGLTVTPYQPTTL